LSRPLTAITTGSSRADTLTISWKILEHGDGAYIDVIYAAPAPGKIVAHGTIEHQGTILAFESPKPTSDFPYGSRWVMKIMGLVIVLMGFASLWPGWKMLGFYRRSNGENGLMALTSLVVLVCVGAFVFCMALSFVALTGDMIPPVF